MRHIFLYGPPLSGKSTLGKSLAARLDLPFIDLDLEIEAGAKQSIAEIFKHEGETGFRQHEIEALSTAVKQPPGVIALGGGALLNQKARELAENNGQILCLEAALDKLLERQQYTNTKRPLLTGDLSTRLQKLLDLRKEHYQSFPLRLDTTHCSIEDLTWQAQANLGAFRVDGMGQAYDVRISEWGLKYLGSYCQNRRLRGPVVVVSDENVGPLYGTEVIQSLQSAGYEASLFCIPPGEAHKNIETIMNIWDHFITAGIDRSSTVCALGGGVVGDLTGFAASTFLRGVSWINVPTSLLAMVDSSLGGKTGFDLPQAKNMVGAFYSPRLVVADPKLLETLPEREFKSGLAEVVKHGVIGDPSLYSLCAAGLGEIQKALDQIVRQAVVVKLKIIEQDPFENGLRQALNLGHTVGHAIEIASGFHLSHGESVAIGMVLEAVLAEDLGHAQPGLSRDISDVLKSIGLPVQVPGGISMDQVIRAVQLDKKRSAGQIHFALPVKIGEVRTGVIIDDWQPRLGNVMRSVQ